MYIFHKDPRIICEASFSAKNLETNLWIVESQSIKNNEAYSIPFMKAKKFWTVNKTLKWTFKYFFSFSLLLSFLWMFQNSHPIITFTYTYNLKSINTHILGLMLQIILLMGYVFKKCLETMTWSAWNWSLILPCSACATLGNFIFLNLPFAKWEW